MHACASSLRQPDRDRLLGRAYAMLALTHVMDFLSHELTGLRGRRLSRALVFARSLQCGFLGHVLFLS
jgi:hypothetical protein